ncbi:leucyl aminopeptidase family protein [Candidatus Parcubacteria bacterium]|uniref:Leucyl aminopeptidase n=1 Tax=Candidatus Kaiserbacteria bacterium CG10_big_fil_rev_8_21_14_0_10_47_16 TaxID=1974608 RepID=A0A2H0UEC3_9BACT|nr:leucyl aminopeptidase family protein [Candidatus Parcubacteria bacterium]PIR84752.1 MAG: leucyl aminopeptidase [Candidatus Kaiserbacteria bacterium CG10_big_fil_rev_8_21_14_0_10_47_16]
MKLKTTTNPIAKAPKGYVRLTLLEKGVERYTEKNGVGELQIIAGKFADVTPRNFRTIVRSIVSAMKKYKIEKIALELRNPSFSKLAVYDEAWIMSTLAENLILADYEYTVYKSKPERISREILVCGEMSAAGKKGFERGTILANQINISRDLANTPGGDMTPALLADKVKQITKGTKVKVKALGLAEIKKLKMGALLGVGQGAKDKPRFIIMEYWGAKKSEKPIVFAGKGITFDTGGLQIKPGMSMFEMHMDMSGGAMVIAAVTAAAKLGLKKNIIGLIPAAENAVSGESMRPGDVLVSMSGKTIDVIHTDAEGRLVLADALTYAKKYNPKLVVDVATLTGAALVAVGPHANVIMTKDRKLEDTLRDLGEESGDYTHPLPLWDEYKQYTRGVHGDIANIPANDTKYGGSINGGMFLSHFTEGMKWVHIDMAPRMTEAPGDHLAKGSTGEPARLLLKIAEKL